MKKTIVIVLSISIIIFLIWKMISSGMINLNPKFSIGQPVDSMNGVLVYYNGMVGHTGTRNTAPDGYNIGLRWQCVEFVKRYYYQQLHHEMPDSYGNAKDFFDPKLCDSCFNTKRGLTQFTNRSKHQPKVEDLLIYGGHIGNKYGHVAIVSFVSDSAVAVIQQNPGPFGKFRDTFALSYENNCWAIGNDLILGWLRKDTSKTSGL